MMVRVVVCLCCCCFLYFDECAIVDISKCGRPYKKVSKLLSLGFVSIPFESTLQRRRSVRVVLRGGHDNCGLFRSSSSGTFDCVDELAIYYVCCVDRFIDVGAVSRVRSFAVSITPPLARTPFGSGVCEINV